MLAFEVSVNGEAVCVAGLEEFGVLTALLTWVRRRTEAEFKPGVQELEFSVGGFDSDSQQGEEHLTWLKRELQVGDEVSLRIVQVEKGDPPTQRRRRDPNLIARSERTYYKRLKRQFERE